VDEKGYTANGMKKRVNFNNKNQYKSCIKKREIIKKGDSQISKVWIFFNFILLQ